MLDLETLSEDALAKMTPVEYAVASNAARNAQAKAEGWDFWTLIPEDAAYYQSMADMGFPVESALQLVKDSLVQSISDCFKMKNGFRPRNIPFGEMSLAELRACLAEI